MFNLFEQIEKIDYNNSIDKKIFQQIVKKSEQIIKKFEQIDINLNR